MNSRILPAIAFVVAMGILFGYAGPTWNGAVASAKASIATDEEALRSAKAFADKEAALTAEQVAIDADGLKRVAVFLPDSVDNVRLILDLNTLAAKSGVSLSNVDVTDNSAKNNNKNGIAPSAMGSVPVPSDPADSADLSLTAIGTYPAFHTFLVGIEKSARLLDARDIVVKGSDTGVYTYQMKVRFYWLH